MFERRTVGSTPVYEAGDRNADDMRPRYLRWMAEHPGVRWHTAQVSRPGSDGIIGLDPEFGSGLTLFGTMPGEPREPVRLHFVSAICGESVEEGAPKTAVADLQLTADLLQLTGFGWELGGFAELRTYLSARTEAEFHIDRASVVLDRVNPDWRKAKWFILAWLPQPVLMCYNEPLDLDLLTDPAKWSRKLPDVRIGVYTNMPTGDEIMEDIAEMVPGAVILHTFGTVSQGNLLEVNTCQRCLLLGRLHRDGCPNAMPDTMARALKVIDYETGVLLASRGVGLLPESSVTKQLGYAVQRERMAEAGRDE